MLIEVDSTSNETLKKGCKKKGGEEGGEEKQSNTLKASEYKEKSGSLSSQL